MEYDEVGYKVLRESSGTVHLESKRSVNANIIITKKHPVNIMVEEVKQSDEESVKRYIILAEQGDADAQYNLGIMYENGRGVKLSKTEAARWYLKAADQNDEYAKEALERLGL